MRSPPIPPAAAAALLSLALALLLCAPVLSDFGGAALGHPQADTWNHVWGYNQVAQALAQGLSPLHTELLGGGGTLWFIDLPQALLLTPLTLAAGPIASYNLGLLLNLWLAGFAAWLLARELTDNARAAAFAGLVYMLSPYLLAQAHSGISETVTAGWLPLSAWALVRWGRAPKLRRALLAGGGLAGAAWASWYHGLFALLLAWPALSSLPHRGQAARWRTLPALLAIWAMLVLPALLAFRATLSAPDALVLRDPERVWGALLGHNAVDLMAFLWPGASPDLLADFDEHLVIDLYLGWAVVLPASWAAWRLPRSRPWVAAGVLAGVLALGPYLRISQRFAELPSGAPVPLPFLSLITFIPSFSSISHAYRFALPLVLCLGLAASMAAAKRPWLLLLLPLWVLETAGALPLPVARAYTPAIYLELPQDGLTVLDLPLSRQVLDRSVYALYQVEHGHPIPYALNDPTPVALRENLLVRAVLAQERAVVSSLAGGLSGAALVQGRLELREQDVGWIVLHLPPTPLPKRAPVVRLLDAACGPHLRVDDALLWSTQTPGLSAQPTRAQPTRAQSTSR